MLSKKTFLDHESVVEKVGEHEMYLFMFKGSFCLLAVMITGFQASSFGPVIMAAAEGSKVELCTTLVTIFAGFVAVLWALYPA